MAKTSKRMKKRVSTRKSLISRPRDELTDEVGSTHEDKVATKISAPLVEVKRRIGCPKAN